MRSRLARLLDAYAARLMALREVVGHAGAWVVVHLVVQRGHHYWAIKWLSGLWADRGCDLLVERDSDPIARGSPCPYHSLYHDCNFDRLDGHHILRAALAVSDFVFCLYRT